MHCYIRKPYKYTIDIQPIRYIVYAEFYACAQVENSEIRPRGALNAAAASESWGTLASEGALVRGGAGLHEAALGVQVWREVQGRAGSAGWAAPAWVGVRGGASEGSGIKT